MIDLEKTAHHKIYKTATAGDTLIVNLQGDAPGFGGGMVQSEMTTIVGMVTSGDVRNLIIDLSNNNYYGSMILGELINLGQSMREKGGRVALVGVSKDMHEILRMMKLDAMWERYPTRSMAVRAMANVPWGETFRRQFLKPAVLVGGIIILLGIFVLVPRKDHTQEYYDQMNKLWSEARHMRDLRVSDEEWQIWNKRNSKRLKALTASLEKLSQNAAATSLIQVTRGHGPAALEKQLDPTDLNTVLAEYFLACTKASLDKEPLPPLPAVIRETYGKTNEGSSATDSEPNRLRLFRD